MFKAKTDDEMTDDERAARAERRAAIRDQIMRDQATNAKRDADALKREAEWKPPTKGR